MIMLISFIPGNPAILMHFNNVLANCVGNNVQVECLQAMRPDGELKKFLLNGPARVAYLVAHSVELDGMEIDGKKFPPKDLAACFPASKKLLPEILFLNTCYGKKHYLAELKKIGIKNIITTERYIALDVALAYGESFIKELVVSGRDTQSIVMDLNNKFVGTAEFHVASHALSE